MCFSLKNREPMCVAEFELISIIHNNIWDLGYGYTHTHSLSHIYISLPNICC